MDYAMPRATDMPPLARLACSMGIGYFGFYLPTMFLSNLIQRRQESIKNAFPDALDLLLICVQSGMSVEAAFGKVSKEIARALDLGSRTVEKHRKNIMRKAGVQEVASLTRWCVQVGLMEP